MKVTIQTLVLATALLVSLNASAQSSTFEVRKDGGSKISFTSEAPLETIDGITSNITGTISLNPTDITKTTATFEVPVSTLRTGVDLRDEHLRGANWLDAKTYPTATLQITEIKGAKVLKPNVATKVKAKGNFTIHGVTKPVNIDGTVRLVPFTDEMKGTPGVDGDALRIAANFKIKLTDYNISVPSIVQLKVSNDISVAASLRAIAKAEAVPPTSAAPTPAAAPAPAAKGKP